MDEETYTWYNTPQERRIYTDARGVNPDYHRQNNSDADIIIVKDSSKKLQVRVRSSDGKEVKTYQIDMKYVHEFLTYLEKGQL